MNDMDKSKDYSVIEKYANELKEKFLQETQKQGVEKPKPERISEVLSEFAIYSRKLYLELGREINDMP